MRTCKHIWLMMFMLHIMAGMLSAQETSDYEQAIEQLGNSESFESDDDAYLQQSEYFLRHPLDINKAEQEDLMHLQILTPVQISSFLQYRKLNHAFISIYELQAIPYWDPITIKKILPYISLSDRPQRLSERKASWRDGTHQLLMGASLKTNQSSGLSDANQTDPPGSSERAYIRYRYQYKKTLQYGITAEKDAGESWFKRAQPYGFDFYSAHFAKAGTGWLKTLILGDYVVNMGQGLLIWQSMGFRKSSEVMLIKRQAPVIRPYHSFGEYLFQRGMAFTGAYRYWSITGFLSFRKMDASIRTDRDSILTYFSSINGSGLHRTHAEIKNKGTLPLILTGTCLKYERTRGHAAMNILHTDFGNLIQQKDSRPYNLYAWSGTNYTNLSLDGAYTQRNFHLFGEYALHRLRHHAFLGGMMISLDPKADLSLIYRNINSSYQSHFGNAFTESTLPSNEKGFYIGLNIRPAHTWTFSMYADIFRFPWLRYAVDAPSGGKEYMIQLSRSIRRQSQFYIRFRYEEKGKNEPVDAKNMREGVVAIQKINWRAQAEFNYSKAWTLRNRVETVGYREGGGIRQSGFLYFMELLYKPMMRPLAFNMRCQYYEADTYDSRVYAYEQDLMYQFSIPAFYGSGYKIYLNGRYKIGKQLAFWIKLSRLWQENIFVDEIKLQMVWSAE